MWCKITSLNKGNLELLQPLCLGSDSMCLYFLSSPTYTSIETCTGNHRHKHNFSIIYVGLLKKRACTSKSRSQHCLQMQELFLSFNHRTHWVTSVPLSETDLFSVPEGHWDFRINWIKCTQKTNYLWNYCVHNSGDCDVRDIVCLHDNFCYNLTPYK